MKTSPKRKSPPFLEGLWTLWKELSRTYPGFSRTQDRPQTKLETHLHLWTPCSWKAHCRNLTRKTDWIQTVPQPHLPSIRSICLWVWYKAVLETDRQVSIGDVRGSCKRTSRYSLHVRLCQRHWRFFCKTDNPKSQVTRWSSVFRPAPLPRGRISQASQDQS